MRTRLWTAALLAALLTLGLTLGTAGAALAQEGPQVQGAVTFDGQAGPAGIGLILLGTDGDTTSECGRTTTVAGGQFTAVLASLPGCAPGDELQIKLAGFPEVEGALAAVPVSDAEAAVAAEFTDLSPALLAEFGLAGIGVSEAVNDAVDAALAERGEQPLVEAGKLTLLLALAIAGVLMLLGLMVWVRYRGTSNGIDGLPFRRQIEGMVLVMVVLAVIILGVTEKIGQEGLVSVLAAIAGYSITKAAGEPAG